MKRTIAVVIFTFSLLINGFSQSNDAKMNVFIDALMKKMTLDEKIGQLNLLTIGVDVTGPVLSKNVEENIKKGNVGAVLNTHTPSAVRKLQDMAVKNTRLGIPLIFGLDVIHGHTTMFPIPLGLASSWDLDLIEHTARIAAEESTADGLNWTFSPMVDICRDPRWGRIAEGAGEDPYLGSMIAKAMVKGYQGKSLKDNTSIMACVKHFALYGAVEAGRDYNTVDMDRVTMYNFYFPPYKAAVDAGAESVMTSFNEVESIPATGNKWLLTDVLRKQWGFKGFVVTDYTAINEMMAHGMGDNKKVTELAFKAGVDMDMVSEAFVTYLKKLLAEKKITQQEIDIACTRILQAKYKLGLFDDPYKNINEEKAKQMIFTESNRKFAREAAANSMVLLKNESNILPLKKTGTIALIGPLADNKRDMFGPHGAAGNWKENVSVMEGFKNVPGINLLYAKGANIIDDTLLLKRLNADGGDIKIDNETPQQLIDEAVSTASKADVVVAVLGESQGMSGEAASRSEIGLPRNQENLLKALVATGKPVVLVLMNGRPLTLEWENNHANAILEAWFPGTEAGNAVADVLFGNDNPSGKLTVSFPYNTGQIPIYYNHKNTGRPFNADQKYTSKYLDVPNKPLYPFGYGLSYTTFNYGAIKLSDTLLKGNKKLTASITVTNSGTVEGKDVVQLYIRDVVGSITRPVKELKGFQKIDLKAGESKTVSFKITLADLKFYNSDLKYDWEPGEFTIMIGTNSGDVKSASINWVK
ncbi:MAG TPA: beta-glucosidase BglX [Ginsengibacter sp.]